MSGSGRRYSDAEMRRILEDATASDAHRAHDRPSAAGHTLAEIREIAGQVGIDPARVDRAAAALERPITTNTFLGFPVTFRGDAAFPFPLSSEHMRLVALEADRIIGTGGSVRRERESLEWYNGRRRAFVGVASGPTEGRVRVVTDHAYEFIVAAGGLTVVGFVGVINALSFPGAGGIVLSAGVVAVTYASVRMYWKWRSQKAVSRIRQLLDSVRAAVTDVSSP